MLYCKVLMKFLRRTKLLLEQRILGNGLLIFFQK
jgi:hypothetical protein